MLVAARRRTPRKHESVGGRGMRPILAFAILVLGASNAAVEPEYSSLVGDYASAGGEMAGAVLVQIESASGRSDRLAVRAHQPRDVCVGAMPPKDTAPPKVIPLASPDADFAVLAAASAAADSTVNRRAFVPIGDLCK